MREQLDTSFPKEKRMSDKGATTELDRFGIRMTVARVEKGISAYQLAQNIGCTVSMVHRMETGKLAPDPETVARIVDILGLELPEGYSSV